MSDQVRGDLNDMRGRAMLEAYRSALLDVQLNDIQVSQSRRQGPVENYRCVRQVLRDRTADQIFEFQGGPGVMCSPNIPLSQASYGYKGG